MVSTQVEQQINKLTRSNNFGDKTLRKIWKVKSPLNICYFNEAALTDELPMGYCAIYKLKENGDFAGYFEGRVNNKHITIFKDSFTIFPNGSTLIGVEEGQAQYLN